jgi:hypothetical protein
MSMPRHALNPVKFAAVAGAVFIALMASVLGAIVSIADAGSPSESPAPALASISDHTWND